MSDRLTEPHNGTNAWQEHVRCGHLDLAATRYAREVAGGVDALVATFLCVLEGALNAPIALASDGPGPGDRRLHASLGRLLW